MPRKLKALRVDVVAATPEQIAEQVLRVSPTKAAHVGALLVAATGPVLLQEALDRVTSAALDARARPGQTAAKLLSVLLRKEGE